MRKKFTLTLFTAILGTLAFALPSPAQRGFLSGRGTAMQGRPHMPSRGFSHGGYLTGPRGHGNYHRSGYYGYAGYPYLYPGYYYSDSYSEPVRSEEPPLRTVVIEKSQPRVETPLPPPPESLVLELQGNHWVRITDSGRTMVNSRVAPNGSTKATSTRTMAAQQNSAMEPARELPPAVLVFRDGHKEEITRYTIIGGTIYTSSDYWNNGSWTRKVPIAELNVPATLELNRERGANFNLPSSPSVVVIRP
jgi:hypothetical protein